MESILDAINEWIKEILIGAINGNLSTMFGDVNEKVGTIAAEVGKTPQGWNANILDPGAVNGDHSPIPEQQLHAASVHVEFTNAFVVLHVRVLSALRHSYSSLSCFPYDKV